MTLTTMVLPGKHQHRTANAGRGVGPTAERLLVGSDKEEAPPEGGAEVIARLALRTPDPPKRASELDYDSG